MISKLKFIIFESVRGFLYARTPVLLSLVTIAISLIVISLSSYSYLMFINYSSSFTHDYKLEVFFNSDLNISDSEEIFNRILTFDAISSVLFFLMAEETTTIVAFFIFFELCPI